MTRGIVANNPGDIRISDINWLGKISPSKDPDFETFDTMVHGIRAMAELLIGYQKFHNLNTLRSVINRYAPPSDNNPTDAYIECVANRTGFDPDATLNFSKFTDLLPVVKGMCDFEQGEAVEQISDEDFEAGVNEALT